MERKFLKKNLCSLQQNVLLSVLKFLCFQYWPHLHTMNKNTLSKIAKITHQSIVSGRKKHRMILSCQWICENMWDCKNVKKYEKILRTCNIGFLGRVIPTWVLSQSLYSRENGKEKEKYETKWEARVQSLIKPLDFIYFFFHSHENKRRTFKCHRNFVFVNLFHLDDF